MLYRRPLLLTDFTYTNVYMLIPNSQFISAPKANCHVAGKTDWVCAVHKCRTRKQVCKPRKTACETIKRDPVLDPRERLAGFLLPHGIACMLASCVHRVTLHCCHSQEDLRVRLFPTGNAGQASNEVFIVPDHKALIISNLNHKRFSLLLAIKK